METTALLNCVYPLVDTLQTKLGLHSPSGKVPRIVNMWDSTRDMLVAPSVYLPVSCEIKASPVSDVMGAVLCRVRGDLYFALWYNRDTDMLTLDLVDFSKATSSEVSNAEGKSSHWLWELIAPGVVASFSKKHRDTKWERIHALDSVEP